MFPRFKGATRPPRPRQLICGSSRRHRPGPSETTASVSSSPPATPTSSTTIASRTASSPPNSPSSRSKNSSSAPPKKKATHSSIDLPNQNRQRQPRPGLRVRNRPVPQRRSTPPGSRRHRHHPETRARHHRLRKVPFLHRDHVRTRRRKKLLRSQLTPVRPPAPPPLWPGISINENDSSYKETILTPCQSKGTGCPNQGRVLFPYRTE